MSCLPGVADGPQNDLFYRPNPIEIFKPFSKQLIFSSKKKPESTVLYPHDPARIESPWLPRLPCAGLREVQISKQPIKSPLTTEGKFSSFIPRVDPSCDFSSPLVLNL